MLVEAQVARDVGTKRADGVRKRGSAKAGMKFLGDGAAANDFAAFENERLEAAFREIERGDECVVTAADDELRAVRWAWSVFLAGRTAGDRRRLLCWHG